ncbi:MAG: hypothetical protein QOJ81_309 [Chloroflexota bacterium]|jgi:hypothetical protein|nr:hypothetical protein [Chloroflexota bacterium]
MSRRNRSARRHTYGKRQHEVRERRPSDVPGSEWPKQNDDWATPEHIDDAAQRDAAYDNVEGWAR